MSESPPRTPLSLRQLAHQVTPLQQQYSADDGNNENELNFANTPRNGNQSIKLDQSISCQSDVVIGSELLSIEQTLSVDSGDDGASEVSVARLKGWLDDFGKQNHAHYVKNNPKATDDSSSIQGSQSIDSDCESDLSVTRLKGWLDDFGKQNRAHYDKVNNIGKVPTGITLTKAVRSNSANAPVSKPVVPKAIRRSTDPAVASAEVKKGPAKTPVRYKSRFKKDEVQATNEGYASVKKIAAWLADDPTSERKMTTVRKGINVINKSRVFEKDLENIIIEENRIVKGSVASKKDLFQSGALAADDVKCETASCVSVSDKKKWLESAFGKKAADQERNDDEDSIVSMSVLDKKQWLQNAFKNADVRDKRTASTPSRFNMAASAPGRPSLTPHRNEAAVMSVKQKFSTRAASRRTLSDTSDPSETKSSHTEEETIAAKHKWQQRAARRSISEPNDAAAVTSPQKFTAGNASTTSSTAEEPCDPPAIERFKTVATLESPARNSVARKWQERKATREKESPQKPLVQKMSGSMEEADSRSPARSDVAKKWQERKVAKQRVSLQGAPSMTTDDKEADTTPQVKVSFESS